MQVLVQDFVVGCIGLWIGNCKVCLFVKDQVGIGCYVEIVVDVGYCGVGVLFGQYCGGVFGVQWFGYYDEIVDGYDVLVQLVEVVIGVVMVGFGGQQYLFGCDGVVCGVDVMCVGVVDVFQVLYFGIGMDGCIMMFGCCGQVLGEVVYVYLVVVFVEQVVVEVFVLYFGMYVGGIEDFYIVVYVIGDEMVGIVLQGVYLIGFGGYFEFVVVQEIVGDLFLFYQLCYCIDCIVIGVILGVGMFYVDFGGDFGIVYCQVIVDVVVVVV